jgi:hypothetical protein
MGIGKRPGWTAAELELLGGLAAHFPPDTLGEQGCTEEGDPWFVLERPDGSALVHFAKIEKRYVSATSQAGEFDAHDQIVPLVLRFLRRNNKTD